MDIARLRQKGWSENEVSHLRSTLDRAHAQHPLLRLIEHASLWLLVITLLGGSIAATVAMLPLIMLSRISVLMLFLVGVCYGLLLVTALHDLGLERRHQHLGVSTLLISSLVAITVVLGAFEARLGPLQIGTVVAGLAFVIGILAPYLVHWRAHAAA